MLLEVHQPVGHLQVGDVEDLADLAERGGIFAVRVDHQDVTLGCGLADAVQDQRGAGRLAGTGRTEQREVLAQHRIDIEPGADVAGREYLADGDRGAPVAGVDLFKIAGGGRINQRARHRIAGDTAAEAVDAARQLLLAAFAEEVDMGHDPAIGAAVLALIAHRGEQPGIADADLDLAADLSGQRHGRIFVLHTFIDALHIQSNLRTGARNFQHHADRQARIVVHASAGSEDIVLRTQRHADKAFEILTADVGHARLSCASVFMWLQG